MPGSGMQRDEWVASKPQGGSGVGGGGCGMKVAARGELRAPGNDTSSRWARKCSRPLMEPLHRQSAPLPR